ncbi:MAG: hypothetical protein HRU20_29470 [Pseudomonadales bacterium]|nr:hypothetical protein [Pseudomonadales bacterium]
MLLKSKKLYSIATISIALLNGCGSGGDGDSSPPYQAKAFSWQENDIACVEYITQIESDENLVPEIAQPGKCDLTSSIGICSLSIPDSSLKQETVYYIDGYSTVQILEEGCNHIGGEFRLPQDASQSALTYTEVPFSSEEYYETNVPSKARKVNKGYPSVIPNILNDKPIYRPQYDILINQYTLEKFTYLPGNLIPVTYLHNTYTQAESFVSALNTDTNTISYYSINLMTGELEAVNNMVWDGTAYCHATPSWPNLKVVTVYPKTAIHRSCNDDLNTSTDENIVIFHLSNDFPAKTASSANLDWLRDGNFTLLQDKDDNVQAILNYYSEYPYYGYIANFDDLPQQKINSSNGELIIEGTDIHQLNNGVLIFTNGDTLYKTTTTDLKSGNSVIDITNTIGEFSNDITLKAYGSIKTLSVIDNTAQSTMHYQITDNAEFILQGSLPATVEVTIYNVFESGYAISGYDPISAGYYVQIYDASGIPAQPLINLTNIYAPTVRNFQGMIVVYNVTDQTYTFINENGVIEKDASTLTGKLVSFYSDQRESKTCSTMTKKCQESS